MAIDHLGKDLEGLGLGGRDWRCLLYLPQIYVGWSSSERDVPYLEGLLDTTAQRTGFPREGLEPARGWLFEKPSRAQFQSGCALLRLLRGARPEPLVRTSDLLEAMIWAVRAVKPPPLAAAHGVDPERSPAWRALNDLEAWLEVDTSHLWLDIWSHLREHGLPASSLPARASAAPPLPTDEPGAPAGSEQTPTPPLEDPADDEHSALLLIREPKRLQAQPFPLERERRLQRPA